MGQPRASGGSKPRGGRVGGQMARGHLTPPPALVQAPVQHQAVPQPGHQTAWTISLSVLRCCLLASRPLREGMGWPWQGLPWSPVQ